MLKLFSTIILLSGFLYAQNYDWQILPNSPEAGRHDDVHFLNPSLGWTVNSSGQICKTNDGGNTWTIQANVNSYLRSVKFADSLNGWVGTLDGNDLLYYTSDGGNTWNPVTNIPEPKPLGICGLSIVGDIIYGVGIYSSPAVLIKSTDKGATWTSVNMSNYASTLVDCYFFTPDSGFATGGSPFSIFGPNGNVRAVVLFTFDGGITWSTKYTGDIIQEWGWKITFPTPDVGYISIENFNSGSILKTTDKGNSWARLNVPRLSDLEGIGFITENHGWVAAREQDGFTTNGGLNWSTPGIEDASQINRFQFFGDSVGYAAGSRIYKYTKNSSVSVKEPVVAVNSYLQSQNYPNPFNPTTTIEYLLPEPSNVLIRIYDGLGKEIFTLFNSYQEAGQHFVIWNGTDSKGNRLSSGPYIYRIDTGKHSESKMMMMLK